MTREDFLRSLIDKDAQGLEIGPSYNPIAARRLGYDIDIIDHADADTLKLKYANEASVDAELIENVDFVWTGGPLSKVVGKLECYDYIVASHVIEHTPDILGFLTECGKLLKPDGRLILAVPDMRKCFDVFRPLSSLGQVLQAHAEHRTRHTPATACDHAAYMAHLDGASGWTDQANGGLKPIHNLEYAITLFDLVSTTTDYHDFHAWVFTPSSFRLIVRDLHEMGHTSLNEVEFYPSSMWEFTVILRKNGAGTTLSRAELLRMTRLELKALPVMTDESDRGGAGLNKSSGEMLTNDVNQTSTKSLVKEVFKRVRFKATNLIFGRKH